MVKQINSILFLNTFYKCQIHLTYSKITSRLFSRPSNFLGRSRRTVMTKKQLLTLILSIFVMMLPGCDDKIAPGTVISADQAKSKCKDNKPTFSLDPDDSRNLVVSCEVDGKQEAERFICINGWTQYELTGEGWRCKYDQKTEEQNAKKTEDYKSYCRLSCEEQKNNPHHYPACEGKICER